MTIDEIMLLADAYADACSEYVHDIKRIDALREELVKALSTALQDKGRGA